MPAQRARYVLPLVINPPKTRCFTINVPDDVFHVAAFMGQIYDLAWSRVWDDDPTHKAAQVARVWQDIFDNLQRCVTPAPMGGASGEDDNMIRQNPDNPCELQTSIDGTNWCTFADLSLCLPAPSQPAREAPQPAAGGGSECYHGTLDAFSNWLVPTPVSVGDTLDLQDAIGAGSDGSGVWRCPDGKIYFAGACQPGTETLDGGDPDGTVYHMALIWVINGSVYLNAMAGPVTVPSGVSNGTAVLQVNDGSLAGNFGSYQITVCVTNNAATTWAHTFDLLLTSGGFTVPAAPFGGAFGHWTPGVGWVADHVEHPSGFWYNQLVLNRTLIARDLTRCVVTFNVHGISTNQSTANARFDVVIDSTGVDQKLFSDTTEGDGLVSDHGISIAGATALEIDSASSFYNSATFTGDTEIIAVRLEGIGTDPY